MSPLRAARTVTDPDGYEWKIYVSRVRLPPWQPVGYDSIVADESTRRGMLADVVWEIPMFLLTQIVVPVIRAVGTLPVAVLRARKATMWRIEAINLWPRRESYLWETTAADIDRVTDMIAACIASGRRSWPEEAVYRGADTYRRE